MTHSMSVLLGLVRGILADGVLNEKEILALNAWLGNHEELLCHWPANIIAERIQDILADGVITRDETENLAETLSRILGLGINSWRQPKSVPTEDAREMDQQIVIPGRSFMLAGTFLYGTHSRCEAAILGRGGLTDRSVSPSLDYLVIGALPESQGPGSEFEVILKQAKAWIRKGCAIKIISEKAWHKALAES
jgi:NAD-dependent DNA ligase